MANVSGTCAGTTLDDFRFALARMTQNRQKSFWKTFKQTKGHWQSWNTDCFFSTSYLLLVQVSYFFYLFILLYIGIVTYVYGVWVCVRVCVGVCVYTHTRNIERGMEKETGQNFKIIIKRTVVLELSNANILACSPQDSCLDWRGVLRNSSCSTNTFTWGCCLQPLTKQQNLADCSPLRFGWSRCLRSDFKN